MKKNIIPLKLLNIFNDKKIKIIFEQYLDYLNSKSLSEYTIKNYFSDLIWVGISPISIQVVDRLENKVVFFDFMLNFSIICLFHSNFQ